LPQPQIGRRLGPKKRRKQKAANLGQLLRGRIAGWKEIAGKVQKCSGMLLGHVGISFKSYEYGLKGAVITTVIVQSTSTRT
jgi:hypothetical protein